MQTKHQVSIKTAKSVIFDLLLLEIKFLIFNFHSNIAKIQVYFLPAS